MSVLRNQQSGAPEHLDTLQAAAVREVCAPTTELGHDSAEFISHPSLAEAAVVMRASRLYGSGRYHLAIMVTR